MLLKRNTALCHGNQSITARPLLTLLVLYEPLDPAPRAIFPVLHSNGALTNTYSFVSWQPEHNCQTSPKKVHNQKPKDTAQEKINKPHTKTSTSSGMYSSACDNIRTPDNFRSIESTVCSMSHVDGQNIREKPRLSGARRSSPTKEARCLPSNF